MVSNGEKTSMKQNPREVVARLSQECSRKGLFVGSAGSVSVKEGDVVFIGPSANQIRASDVEAEDVFELTLDQGLTNSGDGPGQIKVHDMAQVHLDMYKENSSIGCIIECRSTSAIVASLLIKVKNNMTIYNPELVLGRSSRTRNVNIPIIDGSNDLTVLSGGIVRQLKKRLAIRKTAVGAPASATTTAGTPVKPAPAAEVKNEEGEEDGVDSPVLDELEIEIKAGEKDLGEEDFKEEKRVEDEAEVDLDNLFCSAVIVKNKGFFVWAKTWTECINRVEQINQMLEICNQMKLMDFNVFSSIMVASSQRPKMANVVPEPVVQKTAESSDEKTGGPMAPKRPRIEPPPPSPDTDPATETKPKIETAPTADVPAEIKKRRRVRKNKAAQPQPNQQQQHNRQQPQQLIHQQQKSRPQVQQHRQQQQQQQPQPKLALTTRKNRLSQASPNKLQRPAAPSRLSPQARLGLQPSRPLVQVPSPWAIPPSGAGPWFGNY